MLSESLEDVFKIPVFTYEKTLLPDLYVSLEGKAGKNDFANFTPRSMERQAFHGDVHRSKSR